jgi:hypothetical protein
MRPRGIRFTIRGLMIAVLVVAILLSMPIRFLTFLMFCTTILAIMFRCACRLAIMNPSGADRSTRRTQNMRPSRNHLTLIDLMAAAGAAALGMGFIVWDAPPSGVRALFLSCWVIVPVVGILWDRWRGCMGILGGALGGAAYAGFLLIWMIAGPHGPGLPQFAIMPYSLANRLIFVVFGVFGIGLIFGTLMGVAAWLVAAMMGRSVAPTLPSPNDRLVRHL